ncbi:MAG: efflux RND transporter periplasmic adaptor subunit [bacterium]|nr:efflux RND transporter periplasmic adaptor subunit [bacterium]
MKKTAKYTFLSIAVIALAALLIYRITQQKSTAKVRRTNVPLVKVGHPFREDVAYRLQFTGDVLPVQQAGIFSRVTGNLEKTCVEMGTPVRQDQLLAVIDSTELYLQFQQASASYQNARLSFDRTSELYNRSLASKQDKDNAEAALEVAKANYNLAATRLSYARITAPFSGIITRRFLDSGALVSPGTTTLFTLMDLDQVKIIVNILEKDIPLVTLGKTALVSVDAFPGKEFTGKVTRFSEAVNRDTRTMAIEVDIPNPNHLLKPGMFANLSLIMDTHPDAVTITTPAIMKDDSGSYVFVLDDRTARKVRVTTGIDLGTRMEILSGLADTTYKIITTGQQFVKDGGSVTIQP